MTTIALNDRDFTPMSSEGDGTFWSSVAAVFGSGALGAVLGFVFKSGALRAEVTALALRVTAVEAGTSKISEKLEKTATKEDMRDGFDDIKAQAANADARQQARDAEIKAQVNELTKAVYANRNSHANKPIG